jgi:hypothetical protein
METASTGRTHDCTRPVCVNLKTILAKGEPSTHDPLRTFGMRPGSQSDIGHCPRCGGRLQVFAVSTEPSAIAAIFGHIDSRAARAPPLSTA